MRVLSCAILMDKATVAKHSGPFPHYPVGMVHARASGLGRRQNPLYQVATTHVE